MGSRRKEAKQAAQAAREKALELKDQAREVAGHSGEALKGFAEETSAAAKEFASKTKDAAKELVDTIEKAAKGATEEKKKGRRVLKTTLAIGAGFAVFSNERARSAIRSVINRSKASSDQPEVWRPNAPATPNGGGAKTVAGIAEETS